MPDNMIVVRKDSPLVIGKGNGENYIASDIPAILSYTKDFYLLENFEYVLLSRDNIAFYDKDLNKFENGAEVNPEILKDMGIIKNALDGIKVLGNGTLEKKLIVKASKFSASAKKQIEDLGGKAEVI